MIKIKNIIAIVVAVAMLSIVAITVYANTSDSVDGGTRGVTITSATGGFNGEGNIPFYWSSTSTSGTVIHAATAYVYYYGAQVATNGKLTWAYTSSGYASYLPAYGPAGYTHGHGFVTQ